MALSFAAYTGNGSNKNFAVTFPYIAKSDVTVTVDGVAVAFTWISGSLVQTAVAPAVGTYIVVRRSTEKATALVDFEDASTLTESDLDLFSAQTLYVAQETHDALVNSVTLNALGQMDAQSKRISNVADPVAPNDAITKSWAEAEFAQWKDASVAAAVAAEASAGAADVARGASATNAAVATTKAAAAATSESNAAAYLAQMLALSGTNAGLVSVLAKDTTIDATGASDISAKLNAALNSIWASGQTAVIPAGAFNMGKAQIALPDYAKVVCHPNAEIKRTADPTTFDASAPLVSLGNNARWYGGKLNNATVSATSSTSTTIGNGSKTFTVQSGRTFAAGYVRLTSRANRGNYMEGPVTSYSGTTLVVDVAFTTGSGTFADWDICQANAYQTAVMVYSKSNAVVEGVSAVGYWYVGFLMYAVNAPGVSGLLVSNCTFRDCIASAALNRPFYVYGNVQDSALLNCASFGLAVSQYAFNFNPGNATGFANTIQRNQVEACRAIGSLYQGFEVAEQSNLNTFVNCFAAFCSKGSGFLSQVANSGATPTGNKFIGCEAFQCMYGFHLNGAYNATYSACRASYNANGGFFLNDAEYTQLSTFVGCRADNNAGAGFYIGAKSLRNDFDAVCATANTTYGFQLITGGYNTHINGRSYNNTVGNLSDNGNASDISLRTT